MSHEHRLTAQDLMTLRDAALELGEIDLAHELNEVGDKLADDLKDQLDDPTIPPQGRHPLSGALTNDFDRNGMPVDPID